MIHAIRHHAVTMLVALDQEHVHVCLNTMAIHMWNVVQNVFKTQTVPVPKHAFTINALIHASEFVVRMPSVMLAIISPCVVARLECKEMHLFNVAQFKVHTKILSNVQH